LKNPIITLTTDFGNRDSYIAQMKGVILQHCPGASVVDLSHEIAPQNLMETALFTEAALPWFPPGSIHIIVVDPGVGTTRRPIAALAGKQLLLFPDNGLLTLFFKRSPIEKAVVIGKCPFIPDRISCTFHGRDIFAPTAAWLALGNVLESLGPQAEDLAVLPIAEPSFKPDGQIEGVVIHVDRFGNCITNLRDQDLPGNAMVHTDVSADLLPIRKTYADVHEGEILALLGSSGRLELALRNGNLASKFGIGSGHRIVVAPQ
jgi:S-adenosyl-L-methionine hydrolase (adenosine-forming)